MVASKQFYVCSCFSRSPVCFAGFNSRIMNDIQVIRLVASKQFSAAVFHYGGLFVSPGLILG